VIKRYKPGTQPYPKARPQPIRNPIM
jgi:hypothetical protein